MTINTEYITQKGLVIKKKGGEDSVGNTIYTHKHDFFSVCLMCVNMVLNYRR